MDKALLMEEYEAVVDKLIPTGKHGPYCVSRCETLDNIIVTFSLKLPVWLEKSWPEPGTYVILSEIRKKRAGWRAESARFMRPEDRKSQNIRNQKGATKNEGQNC